MVWYFFVRVDYYELIDSICIGLLPQNKLNRQFHNQSFQIAGFLFISLYYFYVFKASTICIDQIYTFSNLKHNERFKILKFNIFISIASKHLRDLIG